MKASRWLDACIDIMDTLNPKDEVEFERTRAERRASNARHDMEKLCDMDDPWESRLSFGDKSIS